MGSLETRGGANYVKDDFYLQPLLILYRSVCSRRFRRSCIMENKEDIWDNGVLVERILTLKKREIESAKRHALEEKN